MKLATRKLSNDGKNDHRVFLDRRDGVPLGRDRDVITVLPFLRTTYRKDGTAVVSPVWFRFQDNTFEVVIAQDDVKLRHLAARPQCELVVFGEAVPPFRGVRVRSHQPMLDRAGAQQARAEIAARYLGEERGRSSTPNAPAPASCCACHGTAPRPGTSRPSCRANRPGGDRRYRRVSPHSHW